MNTNRAIDPCRKYDDLSERTGLYPAVLLEIDLAGIELADLIAQRWTDGQWHGDKCGCTDDRCIGHHHDEREDCGCLPALIQEYLDSKQAEDEGALVWAAYTAAQKHQDAASAEEARQSAAAWVDRWHRHSPTWALDVLVDGREGITVTSRYNDRHWLVWEAAPPLDSPRPLAYRSH